MTDGPVGLKFGNRALAVAKVDRDDRDTGRACGANIGNGISNHDGVLRRAPCGGDSSPQNFGIRFLNAEGVPAADRCEPVCERGVRLPR